MPMGDVWLPRGIGMYCLYTPELSTYSYYESPMSMILVGSLYIYLLGGRRGEMAKGAGKGVVEKNNHYHEHYFGPLRLSP
jgi:hypothetical protein